MKQEDALKPLYERVGREKIRDDIIEVIRKNCIFQIDIVVLCDDKTVVINEHRPLESGEKTNQRVTMIYKVDGEPAIHSEEMCYDSGIERVKFALLYRLAGVIMKERPLGFKE